jgi:hypothetical protein
MKNDKQEIKHLFNSLQNKDVFNKFSVHSLKPFAMSTV